MLGDWKIIKFFTFLLGFCQAKICCKMSFWRECFKICLEWINLGSYDNLLRLSSSKKKNACLKFFWSLCFCRSLNDTDCFSCCVKLMLQSSSRKTFDETLEAHVKMTPDLRRTDLVTFSSWRTIIIVWKDKTKVCSGEHYYPKNMTILLSFTIKFYCWVILSLKLDKFSIFL